MKQGLRDFLLHYLDTHRIMTLATNRPDGWPQATTVSYINDGIILYCFIARGSQKFLNIMKDQRVSVAIASDFSDPNDIAGISLAGTVSEIEDEGEVRRINNLLITRFPEYATWGTINATVSPLIRIEPRIISIVDCSKGFGHSDLVTVAETELANIQAHRHDWMSAFHKLA